MAPALRIFGIRHHGPGSARVLVHALETFNPTAVLIEGPPDASDMIPLAGHERISPPVALVVYEADAPSHAVYYPFAVFSPEWQAIRWGLAKGAAVRFIDLPQSLRPREPTPTADESPETLPVAPEPPPDPLDALAHAAGFTDGEAWWGRLIEERHAEEDPLGLFDAILEAMASARAELGDAPRRPDELVREAHMRRAIRAALKEGFERIAVVTGAWHAPALTAGAIGSRTAKADDDLLKGLAKRKTTATWIPWTHDRLCLDSGYGAGVTSPGWYEHLWVHREQLSERWLTRVARLLRDEDLEASPASIIEAVRLADSLAALRGRRAAGLDELGEATLAILCHGNPLPLRLIDRRLVVGQRLGEVPEEAPTVPLQRDLASQQRSLRLKVSADESVLDLDQRKETDLARSRLLHRLRILGIDWGQVQADDRQRLSTFHEIWKLQWRPELAVNVIEAARWGTTVADAAARAVADRAANATDLGELTAMLDDVMLADLAGAVEHLVARIQAVSAVSTDEGHLMDALPPLARVLRYGNVRNTDAALVEPLVSGLVARVTTGLVPSCGSLDDDAAERMRSRIDAVNAALVTLNRQDLLASWRDALERVGDAAIHGLVAGRAWRLRLDAGVASPVETTGRFALALSHGADPSAASAWLEGFLSGSGLILVHDAQLLDIVDRWLASLAREEFERICPIVRRTFSTFEKAERRQIGERLARLGPGGAGEPAPDADDYDPRRGALVEPVLRLILGDRLA